MSSSPSDSEATPSTNSTREENPDEDSVALHLKLPPQRSDRLRAIAQQLGMTPSMAAKRVIDLVCEEIVTIQDDDRSTENLLQEYQARLDLLHSVEETSDSDSHPPSDEE